MTKKGEKPPTMETPRGSDQKRCEYKQRNAAPKSVFEFHSQKKSLTSTTSILSHSPKTYNTTASLDKLSCRLCGLWQKTKTDLDDFLGPKMILVTWM